MHCDQLRRTPGRSRKPRARPEGENQGRSAEKGTRRGGLEPSPQRGAFVHLIRNQLAAFGAHPQTRFSTVSNYNSTYLSKCK